MVSLPKPKVAVLHIAHHKYGLEPFVKFIDSYRAHDAGVDHDMHIALKGFGISADVTGFTRYVVTDSLNLFYEDDLGFDIGTYRSFIRSNDYDFYCFLNSNSIILGDHWLLKLLNALLAKDVGIVGASGSHESLRTSRFAKSEFHQKREPIWTTILGNSVLNRLIYALQYLPFPNPHIRTNGFMVSADVAKTIMFPKIKSKRQASFFENGRMGLSRQVLSKGLGLRVVGRDGVAFDILDWPTSGAFRSNDQENLLISDNQTQDYALSDRIRREWLSERAWGCRASYDPTT